MSDDKDLGFIPDEDDELGFVADSNEDSHIPFVTKNSKTDSAIKGAEDMLSFGQVDEYAGGVQSLLDTLARHKDKVNKVAGAFGPPGLMIQGLANNALPEGVTKTPNQVNEELLAQGFTGDLDSTYVSARDAVRKEFKEAEEANPDEYLYGQLAGGALSLAAPLGVGKMLTAPFGVAKPSLKAIQAAELAGTTAKAGLLAKTGMAAANAAPGAALIGYGKSESEELPDQAMDVATSVGIGSGLAGGITGGLGGVGKILGKTGQIAGDLFPGLGHAYNRGVEGVQTFGPKFKEQTNQKLNEYVDTLGSFLRTKRDIINQGRQKALQGVDDQIVSVNTALQDEMQMLQSGLSLSKETERQSLMKQINTQSIKTQKNLQSIKKNVGKVYDNLEKEIQDKNISFNVNDEIANFGEDLQMAGLQPDEAMQFQKKFLENFEKGDLSLNELRSVKNKLVGLFNSGKPEVRKSAKMAYGRINDKQVNILETAGDIDLANSMKNANQRYKAILQLEEDYVGQITPNRVTQTIEPSNEMQKTVGSFSTSKPNPKDFRTQDEYQKLAQVADPKFSQQSTDELNKLGSQLKANDALDTAGPSIKDMQSTSNRYQELLKQKDILNRKPEIKTKMDELVNTDIGNEKVLDDYIRGNLKNTVEDIDKIGKVDIKNILDEYKKSTGKNISPEIETLVKDVSLITDAAEGAKGASVQSIGGFKSLGQTPANMLGKAMGKLKRLNDPNAKVFENQIGEALRKGGRQSLDALYFSLMQQPQFRHMIQEDKGNESKP